ncbi:MAG: N-acetyltransferase [Tissierellales bacterium]|jgi:predicted N-acetyltransferase YhbS|nr:N-acetyltransferase [Tissierellales bacterium]
MINIEICLENEKDFREVENLTREAFWNLYHPGCTEHFVIHKLRESSAFIKELDFVAYHDSLIVGNIMYSKAKVLNNDGYESEVLCMGPLSVLPSYQGKGIGSMLMKHTLRVAKDLGFNAVIIFGDPNYYNRFGFKNAEIYNIQTSMGENMEAFMALELYDGALDKVVGKFYEDEVFHVEEKDVDNFDKQFPYKEKLVTDTQLS